MKKGDIVLVTFPFTDLSSFKRRPALVLFTENDDAILAFITSKISFKHPNDIYIESSVINRLETDSVIILRKLFTANIRLIKGKIGELDKNYHLQINQSINALLNF
jgi:mRNA interferase MazF